MEVLSLRGRLPGAYAVNPRAPDCQVVLGRSCYSPEESRFAFERISRWPSYARTPLLRLNNAADALGLGAVLCKDEGGRLGLSSFKALGAVYACVLQASELVLERTGKQASDTDLLEGQFASQLSGLTFTCATDGNHGFSVAYAARCLGCRSRIYIPAGVSAGREQALRREGADVVRLDGIYDEAYAAAEEHALSHADCVMISDSATDHYKNIPARCMAGYSVIVRELVEQFGRQPPTHMILPAGCGGMAAAMIVAFHQLLGHSVPRFIILEPTTADCVFASAVAERRTTVDGDLETVMGGLSCAAVSETAWPVIEAGASGFLRITDEAAVEAVRMFDAPIGDDPKIVAGETGAAGLAGVIALCADPRARYAFGLDETARVLVVNCEGATDPDLHRRLTGSTTVKEALAFL